MAVVLQNHGYCCCCDRKTVFTARNAWLRDHYLCGHCGCIPRERALMHVIETCFPGFRGLAIHESSPADRGCSLKLKRECPSYLASHYFPDEAPAGAVVGRFRNEDLSAQTFESESFDLVVTQDVMEHVFEPEAVFREIARTLKPGGAHVFTVPLINKHLPSQRWARLKGGEVEFLGEAEYHGNPIDDHGSPVTFHWGYDLADWIFESSKMTSSVFIIDNLELGIRAEYIEVIVSRKPVGKELEIRPGHKGAG